MKGADYYKLTEESYLALCPDRSSHMNMGLWPASSLKEAQRNLVSAVLDFHLKHASVPTSFVDAGSGWGGARAIFQEKFPGAAYIGINSSANQIKHSTELNKKYPDTTYRNADIHEIDKLDLSGSKTLLSIEAAFHFPNKNELFKKIADAGILEITIADICVEDKKIIDQYPLMAPALEFASSLANYKNNLIQAGFNEPIVYECSEEVFRGWAGALLKINENSYLGKKKFLKRFQQGFTQMADLSEQGAIKYVFLHSKKVMPH